MSPCKNAWLSFATLGLVATLGLFFCRDICTIFQPHKIPSHKSRECASTLFRPKKRCRNAFRSDASLEGTGAAAPQWRRSLPVSSGSLGNALSERHRKRCAFLERGVHQKKTKRGGSPPHTRVLSEINRTCDTNAQVPDSYSRATVVSQAQNETPKSSDFRSTLSKEHMLILAFRPLPVVTSEPLSLIRANARSS